MDWFRWYHGAVNDPKWRLVANEADAIGTREHGDTVEAIRVADVLAVWATMLDRGSRADTRGEIDGWDDRVVAAGLDLHTDYVRWIRLAMSGLTLDGDKIINWDRYQPKRERDDNSTARVAAHRDRKRQETPLETDGGHVTPRNATEDQAQEPQDSAVSEGVTPRNAKKRPRLEEIRGEKEKQTNARVRAHEAKYRFNGRYVRLTQEDFDRWKCVFSRLDLDAECQAYDDFLASEKGADRRKNWFAALSALLRKRHDAKPTGPPTRLASGRTVEQIDAEIARDRRRDADRQRGNAGDLATPEDLRQVIAQTAKGLRGQSSGKDDAA